MSDDIFSQYSTRGKAKESLATVVETTEYQAVEKSRPKHSLPRFKVYYHNGTIGLMAYTYLVEVIATSDRYVSLVFTNCVIRLKGERLATVIDDVQQERVVALQLFNPALFAKPDPSQPVIHEITRLSLEEFKASPPDERPGKDGLTVVSG